MVFEANQQVTVKIPQLRSSLSELRRGRVVSATVDRVSVQFPGEFKPKDYPVIQVTPASNTFGLGSNVDDPYEKPVVQMFRNR
jgi:hypothetical protein